MHALAMSACETTAAVAQVRIAELETALAVANSKLVAMTKERDALRASHARLREELELLKRRIFLAKAERIDTAQLEMEFAEKLRQLDTLAGTLGDDTTDTSSSDDDEKKDKKKSTGRRDLKKLPLEEERVEITDPLYEQLVAEGKAKRIDFEESCKLAYKRGGMRRLVIARAKYQVIDNNGETAIETTPMPAETFARSLAAPSLLAHIVMLKYGQGMPLFRIEDGFARDGCPVDRGTMCRWVEDAGATCGATVVHAARQQALATAFCIAADATGVLVQPIRTHEKIRTPCKRGHYFVHIADRDHVFFDYTAQETSDAVAAMFKGFSGYVQVDAKSVYDVLFRPPESAEDDDGAVRHEIGCMAHYLELRVIRRDALVRGFLAGGAREALRITLDLYNDARNSSRAAFGRQVVRAALPGTRPARRQNAARASRFMARLEAM